MKYSVFFIALLIVSLISSAQGQQAQLHLKDTISVVGYGEVSAEPDMAIISISVSAINVDVNKAKSEADAKYSKVLAAAKGQGIDRKDIKLSTINLNPEYQWRNNTQNLIGTRVSRSLTVTIKQMEKVAPLLQDLVEGDVSRIDRVQTDFQNRTTLERKALAAAIVDAKEKAQYLADQFDKRLASAYSVSEQSQLQPNYRQFNKEMARSSSMAAGLPEGRRILRCLFCACAS